MNPKSNNKSDTEALRSITDSASIRGMIQEEKKKLLEISLDVTMGKEKNNQLKRLKKKTIARLLTRLNQIGIIEASQKDEDKTENQAPKKEQE